METHWYFDFVSPFAYLQLAQLDALPANITPIPVPVLFAGLLGHHGNLGPAEIPAKRRHTYRHCQWYAQAHGIPYRMPPAHPFNPIGALRLCLVAGAELATVRTIFGFIFADGRRPDEDAEFDALAERLGIDNAREKVQAANIKAALRENTERAAQAGVFGVPTLAAGGESFWGLDATQMFVDYMADRAAFENAEMQRVSALPSGVQRKR